MAFKSFLCVCPLQNYLSNRRAGFLTWMHSGSSLFKQSSSWFVRTSSSNPDPIVWTTVCLFEPWPYCVNYSWFVRTVAVRSNCYNCYSSNKLTVVRTIGSGFELKLSWGTVRLFKLLRFVCLNCGTVDLQRTSAGTYERTNEWNDRMTKLSKVELWILSYEL